MDLIKIISIILLFFLWGYILYRWKKTERELDKFREVARHYWMRNIELENQLNNYRKLEEAKIQEAWIKTLNADKYDTYKKHAVNPSPCLGKWGGIRLLTGIILPILTLIVVVNNFKLRKDLEVQEYTSAYLFSKYVKECDMDNIKQEIQRAKKHFK